MFAVGALSSAFEHTELNTYYKKDRNYVLLFTGARAHTHTSILDILFGLIKIGLKYASDFKCIQSYILSVYYCKSCL